MNPKILQPDNEAIGVATWNNRELKMLIWGFNKPFVQTPAGITLSCAIRVEDAKTGECLNMVYYQKQFSGKVCMNIIHEFHVNPEKWIDEEFLN